MKKHKTSTIQSTLLLMILLVLTITACSSGKSAVKQHGEQVEVDGQSLVVVFNDNSLSAGSIQAENGEYTFEYDGADGITIKYPDGHIFRMEEVNGAIQVNESYSTEKAESKGYVDGYSLVSGIGNALSQTQRNRKSDSSSFLYGILFICVGIVYLLAPQSACRLAYRRRYRNAELSGRALILYRLLGVLLMFVGIMCILTS